MTINQPAHITGSIARTLLALTFLFSGFVKAIDPLGTVYKIEDYLTAFGGVFTSLLPLATTAAVLLILTEWTLGVMMLLNVRTGLT
ncbi:MAG: DoxX family protein, partial [Paludibacteraceae bacterium]|nr:DoxX family protein [Paludibacteraceae bacterium]